MVLYVAWSNPDLTIFELAYSSAMDHEPTENCKMKKKCEQWDFKPVRSDYEANTLTIIIALVNLISLEHLEADHVLPEFAV